MLLEGMVNLGIELGVAVHHSLFLNEQNVTTRHEVIDNLTKVNHVLGDKDLLLVETTSHFI